MTKSTRKPSRRPAPSEPADRKVGVVREHRALLALVALLWLLVMDDRHVGIIADGRQMIWTAIAITETGGISQASGRDFSFARPDGTSVSRYGMGMSFAQMPAAWLAPRIEAVFGPASSQPLFLLAPLLLILAAAAASARVARELGAGTSGERLAILLTGVASPLASYATLEFSEPLQAACLAGALAAALSAQSAISQTQARRWCLAAGACAGMAILAKSSLIIVAPLALLPILSIARLKPAVAVPYVITGVVPPAGLWLIFEIVRFGRPLAAYEGETFSHPLFDGLWRLLVGVNKGLLWYFPPIIASGVMVWWLMKRRDRQSLLTAAAITLPFLVLLLTASMWWAWHGNEGWGPRLLVPSIPILAAAAAVAMVQMHQAVRWTLGGLALLANVFPILQHPTPIATYVNSSTWPAADDASAHGIPDYARRSDGAAVRISPDNVLAVEPSASPFLLYPWFAGAKWSGGQETFETALSRPPWLAARPDIVPQGVPLPAGVVMARESRVRFWGRGFRPSSRQREYVAVYDEGLTDQVIAAQQRREGERALALALALDGTAPSGQTVALVLESYRLLHRSDAARSYLSSVPRERRNDPRINVVLALFERDAGNDEGARSFLQSVAGALAGTPAESMQERPVQAWPSDLDGMLSRGSLASNRESGLR